MASLSKVEWDAARKTWSEDSRAGYGWLAESLGVSRQAVNKMATKQAWKKVALVAREPSIPQSAQLATNAKITKKAPSFAATTVPCLASGHWQMMTRRPRGRPTDYRDEFIDEIVSYFDIPVESVVDVDVADRDGRTVTEKKVVINTFPTVTRFASSIGVTRGTLHDWATAKNPDGTLRRPEFSYAYTRAKDLQDALLVEGGLSGRYEGRFAVFAAKNLIGWRDQIETTAEITVTGATVELLDQLYREGMEAAARNKAAVIERNKSNALAAATAAK
ncbi:terminase small subunit [Massilia glaciei]|uniref:Uncharacterized protein n=1 Tax=Massilia glaciei TaxID=1524097 RepID=A0A2U2I5Q5_9BURK|nr:terminase small subunit [Massilia glaciei]PWF55093.1 hypothetical protein C7C56_003665 [Massilia glaciei]